MVYYGFHTKFSNKDKLNMIDDRHNIDIVYIKDKFKPPTIDEIKNVISKINPQQSYKSDISNIPIITTPQNIKPNQILVYSLFSSTLNSNFCSGNISRAVYSYIGPS